jgi:hypothetical protein
MNSCVLIIGLQLYREIKSLTQAPSHLNHCIPCRIDDARRRRLRTSPGIDQGFSEDPTNVADQGFSEDPTNVAKDLTEAPNQSSENFDTPAPDPTQEGKPQCIPSISIYYYLLIYYISCITSRS